MKARGIAHSNQVREFLLSDHGIDLVEVYTGSDQVLTGTARMVRAMQDQAAVQLRQEDHERLLRQLAGKRKALEAQIAALQAELEVEESEVNFAIAQDNVQTSAEQRNPRVLGKMRGADSNHKPSEERRRENERKKA